ncbi:DotH/IcmK family type IV secretion protein [Erwinia sp. STN24]|uniref:DotH/IcmK family type IV secretion protein n=1 Tax=Erwinia sp. STN24 TaxID=3233996 RepID=UPI003522F76C
MKLKTLTFAIAAILSVHSAFAAEQAQQPATGNNGANDVANWQPSQASMSAPPNNTGTQQPQQQPQQQVQQQPQQQVQQQPQQQVQQQPTTAISAAPAATFTAQPQKPATTQINRDNLDPLPAPVINRIQPLTPGQIRTSIKTLDESSAAARYQFVTPVPRVSSQTVSLSAGSSIPQVRVYPNVTTTITFSDITGHPWNLGAAPVNSSPCQIEHGTLCVNYIPGSAVFTIQPTDRFSNGNVTVLLQGLATPVIINVKALDPSNQAHTVDVDYRLDLRIPKRGPDTPVYTATPEKKISLYDKQLQQFLDGIPPEEAQLVKLHNAPGGTKAWQIGDELYVRSPLQLQDEFEKTLSAIDGTHVYVLPSTPVLTFSENGSARDVDVELN